MSRPLLACLSIISSSILCEFSVKGELTVSPREFNHSGPVSTCPMVTATYPNIELRYSPLVYPALRKMAIRQRLLREPIKYTEYLNNCFIHTLIEIVKCSFYMRNIQEEMLNKHNTSKKINNNIHGKCSKKHLMKNVKKKKKTTCFNYFELLINPRLSNLSIIVWLINLFMLNVERNNLLLIACVGYHIRSEDLSLSIAVMLITIMFVWTNNYLKWLIFLNIEYLLIEINIHRSFSFTIKMHA
ncbi:hypothetical protein AGLY_014619 [Aphis glycines]|uniref:Uncharacterized protein n=1 Tax=Aphis glycines TaxID=307491 RepID=A0A6G0T1W0_APHGL|nr:hypothetical protein AGLY_014619 [Aphis glycines]